ncbi:S8 family peptidase [Nocardia sp. 004]|uniref:S8 family peptidase n=1 Tax=Nocardia sp. 004 TaxID=3385978 RepID=UPI0039A11FCE
MSDTYREKFLKLFEDFLTKDNPHGKPTNRSLVANIGTIKRAVLHDLWQSEIGPPLRGVHWWEIWLDRTPTGAEALDTFTRAHGLRTVMRRLELNDRMIVWVEACWDQLQALPFTGVPVAEIRKPEFVDTIEDLTREEHEEYTSDLLKLIQAADRLAPAVCHLDTGVRRSHILLSDSLAPADTHSVVDLGDIVKEPHGTQMAGLALFGPLDDLLTSTEPVLLTHRLESVKILPDPPVSNDPLAYGLITAQATASVETAAPERSRVFCMPITAPPETGGGEPTLWSAAIDALSVGTDIGQSPEGIGLLGAPDPAAARLFLISAGNTPVHEHIPGSNYLDLCDNSPIETPAQAWNALTVGAHTRLTSTPTDPSFENWTCLAGDGELSPHSRTSLHFGATWPIKPDICMEGGNLLTNGTDVHDHPIVCVRTTSGRDDFTVTKANATSAATAQAARLAARAMAGYPGYWPESIRGLLVHSAEWTPSMRQEVYGSRTKRARQQLLRRYGWGVPTEQAVLTSAANAVTLVTQDEFVPFSGPKRVSRNFRLHDLPMPTAELYALAEAEVQLRITLSYFIEPTASRRGWNSRYAYGSHGLRFILRSPLETDVQHFIARVNQEAQDEETGSRPPSGSHHWLLGEKQRTHGSLHQDIWEGSAADLAKCDRIAVYPVGGWWKNNSRSERVDQPVRYSLIISIRIGAEVDIYTPIAAEIAVPTALGITLP